MSAKSLDLDLTVVHERASASVAKLCSLKLRRRSRRSRVSGTLALNACLVDIDAALAKGDADPRRVMGMARAVSPPPSALGRGRTGSSDIVRSAPGMPSPIEPLDLNRRLYVSIAEARGLLNADTTGLSDPYVRVVVDGVEHCRTASVTDTLSPKWNETFMLSSPRDLGSGGTLKLVVCDEDYGFSDDFLGQVEMPLAQLREVASADAHRLRPHWHLLNRDPKQPNKRAAGELRFRAWLGEPDADLLSNTGVSVFHEPHTWLLRLTIEEAQHLRKERGFTGDSDPYAVVTVGADQRFKTPVRRKTLAPRWNTTFYLCVTEEILDDDITIRVHDYEPVGNNPEYGRFSTTLRELVNGSAERSEEPSRSSHGDDAQISEWFDLQRPSGALGGLMKRAAGEKRHAGLVKVSAEALPSANELTSKQRTPVGTLRVDVLSASMREGLVCAPDCYAVVRLGTTWYRTPTIRDNCNPAFDVTATMDVHDPQSTISYVARAGARGRARDDQRLRDRPSLVHC